MAVVTLKVYTTLKDRLGFSQIDVDAENLKQAVEKLCDMNKEIKNILFENKNKIKNYFVITLNSEIIDNSRISRIKLTDGDIINIFPPVSGG
ncbi:MAG: MoaD/ThiS family protein [Elusimicrobiales bacterium]